MSMIGNVVKWLPLIFAKVLYVCYNCIIIFKALVKYKSMNLGKVYIYVIQNYNFTKLVQVYHKDLKTNFDSI
jgi:Na+-transporting NADH:ubiquinone oxidoreductase subunit NqrE